MKASEKLEPAEPRKIRTRKMRSGFVREDETSKATASREREVAVTGPEAEANCLLDRLAPLYARQVEFYVKEYEDVSIEDGRQMAADLEDKLREQAAETPPRRLRWRHLSAVAKTDIGAALELWEKIKQEAAEELATGARVTEVVFPGATPFDRARYFALRDEMADGWRPLNGIEHALVDMLALNYSLWLHWTGLGHIWATSLAEHNTGEVYERRERGRAWKVPRYSDAEAVEQAHRLADSYNRQFLRVLRQLRDLRRYAPPVIVNNGGQVNVAQNQVNAQRAG